MTPNVNYGRNYEELKEHRAQKLEAILVKQDDDDVEDLSRKEYIFLIDRSYSMYHTIKLAREALTLFLYSLPAGSKFNICSYGSCH